MAFFISRWSYSSSKKNMPYLFYILFPQTCPAHTEVMACLEFISVSKKVIFGGEQLFLESHVPWINLHLWLSPSVEYKCISNLTCKFSCNKFSSRIFSLLLKYMSPNSVSDLHILFGIKWNFFNINIVLCFEKIFRRVDGKITYRASSICHRYGDLGSHIYLHYSPSSHSNNSK